MIRLWKTLVVPSAINTDFFLERNEGGGMRVGKDFQAVLPLLKSKEDGNVKDIPDRALLLWRPPPDKKDLPEEKLADYMEHSKKFKYSTEAALGLLLWHKYDITKATENLRDFTTYLNEWTVEDNASFDDAIERFGKDFERMKTILPQKSMKDLIQHYYKGKSH